MAGYFERSETFRTAHVWQMLNDNSTGNTENIGQLYTLFCENSFTPLLTLQEKIHRPAAEGRNNDSNARIFILQSAQICMGKASHETKYHKTKDCAGLQKFLRTVTSEHNISGGTLLLSDDNVPAKMS